MLNFNLKMVHDDKEKVYAFNFFNYIQCVVSEDIAQQVV